MSKNDDEGEVRRKKGIERVTNADPEWHACAWAVTANLPEGHEITAEQIRALVYRECGNPKSPNSWGALMSHLTRKGRLVDTGRVTRCTIPSSHKRRIPIWRIAGFAA